MSRRARNGRRAALEQAPRGRGGGLFLGLVIGLALGVAVAAGIAWYLTSNPPVFKPVAQAPLPAPQPGAPAPKAADPPSAIRPAAPGPQEPAVPARPPASPAPKPAPAARPATPPPGSDYTFFDILPGEQTPRDRLAREVWWLQVAALREVRDADRLKARLALLGLPVQIQPVAAGGATLHRVRVGPFKTEDEALGALDRLSENDFEARLLKEKLEKP